jgi:hypothetical protein
MQVAEERVKLMAVLLVQVEQVAVVLEQPVLVSQLLELPILAVEVVVDMLERLTQFQVSLQMQQVAQVSLS